LLFLFVILSVVPEIVRDSNVVFIVIAANVPVVVTVAVAR